MSDNYNDVDEESSCETIKGLPEACVYVSSVSPNSTKETIHKYFEDNFGEVLKVTLVRKETRRSSIAFVQFAEAKHARQVVSGIETHIVDGSRLTIEKAKVRSTLFVAKIGRNMINQDLRSLCEVYGPVESVAIIKDKRSQESKGCAFIKFVYREDAFDALVGLKQVNKNWIVEWAKTNTEEPAVDTKALYVGGLDAYRITEGKLSEKFSNYGEIASLSLINPLVQAKNDDGENNESMQNSNPRPAYAFICYHDSSSAYRAIENENGQEWLGGRLRVQHPISPESKREQKKTQRGRKPNQGAPQNQSGMPYYYYPMPYPPYPMPPSQTQGNQPQANTPYPNNKSPNQPQGQPQGSYAPPPQYPPGGFPPANNGQQSSGQPGNVVYPYPWPSYSNAFPGQAMQ